MQEIRRKQCSDPKCIWERLMWGKEKTPKESSSKNITLVLTILCLMET